jgi:type II secretory pathway component PulK
MSVSGRDRARGGVVLLVVLFFALLLTSGVATFVRRSTVDALVARNRDAAGEADALIFGGMQLALTLLDEDRLEEAQGGTTASDTRQDIWATLSGVPLVTPTGATLRLDIQDSGSRLNLNSLFEVDETGAVKARDETLPFLESVLTKVIDDMPGQPAEKRYKPADLAENLIDFVDSDDITANGSSEDDVYQQMKPPYRAQNRPLLSIEELRLVAGFDAPLVDALRQYVTVYPFVPSACAQKAKGCGVNINTAPPHVLALLWFDDGVEKRLANEDEVRQILRVRADGGLLCGEGESVEGCTPIRDIVPNAIFPPPTFSTQVFVVEAEASVGDLHRTGVAVIDRTAPALPQVLSWRIR